METTKKRTDVGHRVVIKRVDKLEMTIENLRNEFESHTSAEEITYKSFSDTLAQINEKVDKLRTEIKEPLETYRTAKYGMNFLKFIGETAKWFIPLIVGLILGYGAISAYQSQTSAPHQQERKE